jgi:hypothetical protein
MPLATFLQRVAAREGADLDEAALSTRLPGMSGRS